MMHSYIPGSIIQIKSISPRVKQFFWKPDDECTFDFTPGQFCIIHFPSLGGSMPYRSYSIAGVENNVVEFCISLKENGKATELLWQMKEGNKLDITESKGSFTLREPIAKKVIFIATGTGVAPFKPMISQLLESKSEIHLVYGNRFMEDILYKKHWEGISDVKEQFFFHPILSRELINGKQGYVHEIYPHLFNKGDNVHFYICGWSEMIKETRKNLKSKGFSRREYFIESYD